MASRLDPSIRQPTRPCLRVEAVGAREVIAAEGTRREELRNFVTVWPDWCAHGHWEGMHVLTKMSYYDTVVFWF